MLEINLGGEKRPYQITPFVVGQWMEKTGSGFDGLQSISMNNLIELHRLGFISGHKRKNGDLPEWTDEDFYSWVDGPEAFKALSECNEALSKAMEGFQ